MTDLNTKKLTQLIDLAIHYLDEHSYHTPVIDPKVLAYRWAGGRTGRLVPIDVAFALSMTDLLGIERQKQALITNTRQFLSGLPANHVLMTGARGAGKSSLVRALLAEFHHEGLRVIEVARDDLQFLDRIRQAIRNAASDTRQTHDQPCRYILYCDDLAFNTQDENYRTLKSLLDGSLDSEQEHLLVYATSNRRHLLPQLMKDNINIYNGQTDEVNPYETIDETVSLSDRFGLWLSFHAMRQSDYLEVVAHYLAKAGISLDEAIQRDALQWAAMRGGVSGRIAYQFSRQYIGKVLLRSLPQQS